MPPSHRAARTEAMSQSMLMPRAVNTSAAPDLDDSARLPCLATGTPAPETMKAAQGGAARSIATLFPSLKLQEETPSDEKILEVVTREVEEVAALTAAVEKIEADAKVQVAAALEQGSQRDASAAVASNVAALQAEVNKMRAVRNRVLEAGDHFRCVFEGLGDVEMRVAGSRM